MHQQVREESIVRAMQQRQTYRVLAVSTRTSVGRLRFLKDGITGLNGDITRYRENQNNKELGTNDSHFHKPA